MEGDVLIDAARTGWRGLEQTYQIGAILSHRNSFLLSDPAWLTHPFTILQQHDRCIAMHWVDILMNQPIAMAIYGGHDCCNFQSSACI